MLIINALRKSFFCGNRDLGAIHQDLLNPLPLLTITLLPTMVSVEIAMQIYVSHSVSLTLS